MSDLWVIPFALATMVLLVPVALPGQPRLDPANPIPLPSWADATHAGYPSMARWTWATMRLFGCSVSFAFAWVAVGALGSWDFGAAVGVGAYSAAWWIVATSRRPRR